MVETRRRLSEKSEKAIGIYLSEIKPQLSDEDDGRYVAIDAHTGAWLLGDSIDVSLEMRDQSPGSHPVVVQHPNIYARLWIRQYRSFE